MGFPDRIERTVELAHPPGKVWTALTTAEGLSAWFGNKAEIDLRPGGSARMRWDHGFTAEMRVERVEEPAVFGFTWHICWLPEDDPRRTYVEFTLEPAGPGTRLTVVESGFAQPPEDVHRQAYGGNSEGWARELGELASYLGSSGPTSSATAATRRSAAPGATST
ncbi:MAG: SRPBCC domain-containing protein [Streptosporangiaceae bacterium]